MNVLTKNGFALCERCLEQARHQGKEHPAAVHALPSQATAQECPIHTAIFSPSRVRYPYISAELQKIWNTAQSLHANPVAAWKSIQEDEYKRAQYIAGRGQKNFVRISWPEALHLCTAALLHTITVHGPECVLGHAPNSRQSVINHVAGSRFLHLLGATCMQEKLDFASWSMLSTASDWFEIPQRQSQKIHNPTQSAIKAPHVLLSWTSEALHLTGDNNDNIYENGMLDLLIGAACEFNNDAMLCDILLPSTHAYEFQDISSIFTMHYKQARSTPNEDKSQLLKTIRSNKQPAMLHPQWESKSPWVLFQEFACSLSALSKKTCNYDNKIHELMDIHNKYSLLGPHTVQENFTHEQYDLWSYANKYEILKAQLGIQHHSSTPYGMPKVTSCQDACNIMLFLQ